MLISLNEYSAAVGMLHASWEAEKHLFVRQTSKN